MPKARRSDCGGTLGAADLRGRGRPAGVRSGWYPGAYRIGGGGAAQLNLGLNGTVLTRLNGFFCASFRGKSAELQLHLIFRASTAFALSNGLSEAYLTNAAFKSEAVAKPHCESGPSVSFPVAVVIR